MERSDVSPHRKSHNTLVDAVAIRPASVEPTARIWNTPLGIQYVPRSLRCVPQSWVVDVRVMSIPSKTRTFLPIGVRICLQLRHQGFQRVLVLPGKWLLPEASHTSFLGSVPVHVQCNVDRETSSYNKLSFSSIMSRQTRLKFFNNRTHKHNHNPYTVAWK